MVKSCSLKKDKIVKRNINTGDTFFPKACVNKEQLTRVGGFDEALDNENWNLVYQFRQINYGDIMPIIGLLYRATIAKLVFQTARNNQIAVATLNVDKKVKRKRLNLNPIINSNKEACSFVPTPYLSPELIAKAGGTGIRTHSTVSKDELNLNEALCNEKWNPVYRFNGIVLGAFLAKAKIIQTIVSTFLIPYATYNLYVGQYDFQWFSNVCFVSILAPVFLFIFSKYYSRIIGVISMTNCNEYVRVGYLSFWGTRQNRFIRTDDIMPIFDTVNTSSKHLILPLQQYSRQDNLFLATKGIEIMDGGRAKILFGDLSLFNGTKKDN
uniref:Transmembrane protein 186 n=1 Tax=Rhabditophanes sp. KR3021 TaxID=114890 RepID=A0AC35UHK2_9BILA